MSHTAPVPAASLHRAAFTRPCHEPGAPVAGMRPVSVAVALLDRYWPAGPVPDSNVAAGALAALERDRRYLIGRFQQALSVLLAAELPPMDPLTSLLSGALCDAVAWREHQGRPCADCAGDDLCPRCEADSDLADRYHALARALGAVADPAPPPAADHPPR
jgi:hypothetical protein